MDLIWGFKQALFVSQNRGSTQASVDLSQPAVRSRITWDDTARAILGLSKMNWNNDSLYNPLPVTLAYAKSVGEDRRAYPQPGNYTYQFRFFM